MSADPWWFERDGELGEYAPIARVDEFEAVLSDVVAEVRLDTAELLSEAADDAPTVWRQDLVIRDGPHRLVIRLYIVEAGVFNLEVSSEVDTDDWPSYMRWFDRVMLTLSERLPIRESGRADNADTQGWFRRGVEWPEGMTANYWFTQDSVPGAVNLPIGLVEDLRSLLSSHYDSVVLEDTKRGPALAAPDETWWNLTVSDGPHRVSMRFLCIGQGVVLVSTHPRADFDSADLATGPRWLATLLLRLVERFQVQNFNPPLRGAELLVYFRRGFE